MLYGQKAFDELLSRYKDIAVLRSASSVLYWDMETKMPPRGIGLRAEQLGLLDVMSHDMLVDQKTSDLLERSEERSCAGQLDDEGSRDLYLIRRYFDEEVVLPQDLVEETSKQQTISIDAWKKAKISNRFDMFRPELEKNIILKKRAAELLMGVKRSKTPYDAMIDLFEPGMTSEKISSIFTEMRSGLMAIIKELEDAGISPTADTLSKKVPIQAQRNVSKIATDIIGYDISGPNAGGRLDETEHPFTNGYFDDVRITTHYHEDNVMSNLFSVMHESGHALYEQNIPRRWIYRPIGSPCSYGIHESQSRFMENIIGRSQGILRVLLRRINDATNGAFGATDDMSFIRAVNSVERTKIRTEADETTYGLHIIIRFEIERDIFSGKLSVGELPARWNELYSKYLGVEIENDAEGVLQDTHWAGGSFGYFPSYALGNIYGGMMLQKMESEVPDWEVSASKGNLSPVRSWLTDNVHSKGNLYDPADLIRGITGKDLDVKPFLEYLRTKYRKIYEY